MRGGIGSQVYGGLSTEPSLAFWLGPMPSMSLEPPRSHFVHFKADAEIRGGHATTPFQLGNGGRFKSNGFAAAL